jgi:deazaflavin-dependent oxidoreductase (nitroreductase family)
MPLPGGLAKFNRLVTNRVMKPFAARVGGFAVLEHTGRRSGKTYETPLNVFRGGDSIVVALTYGPDVDWLRNTRAHEASIFVIQGERVRVGRPQPLARADGYERVPRRVRAFLSALDVSEFVVFPILEPERHRSG